VAGIRQHFRDWLREELARRGNITPDDSAIEKASLHLMHDFVSAMQVEWAASDQLQHDTLAGCLNELGDVALAEMKEKYLAKDDEGVSDFDAAFHLIEEEEAA
jgi:hypothetical protein